MKQQSLGKIMLAMLLVLALVSGGIWLTSSLTAKSQPTPQISSAVLNSTLNNMGQGANAESGSKKDWATLLNGAAKDAAKQQSSPAKPLTDSQMHTVVDVLGKSGQQNVNINTNNFSRDTTSKMSSAADRASKAFEQMLDKNK